MTLVSLPACFAVPRPGRAGLLQLQAPDTLVRAAERLDASSGPHRAAHEVPTFLDLLAVLVATDPVAIETARDPASGLIHLFLGAAGDDPILWANRQVAPLDALTADLAACKRLGFWPRLPLHRGRHRHSGLQRDRIDILLQPEETIDAMSSHAELALRRTGRTLRALIAAERTSLPAVDPAPAGAWRPDTTGIDLIGALDGALPDARAMILTAELCCPGGCRRLAFAGHARSSEFRRMIAAAGTAVFATRDRQAAPWRIERIEVIDPRLPIADSPIVTPLRLSASLRTLLRRS